MKHLEGVGRSLIARFKKSFSKKTKKHFFVVLSILGVVAVGALLVNVHPIFAQSTEPGPLDSLLILLAGFAVSIAGVIGQLIVFILDALTIPLMSYNGFSSSGVVGAGWSIVRDVVNMFFVIVLIAIAFGTIFGNSRFQWQQQVPRLLLFAVLINFSRTISGLMIDAAQVFMFTFVNAFKDIAGGNFIELFGLRSIVRINADHPNLINAANGGGGAGFSPFDWFGAGIMSVLMMVIVAATVVALTVIMAWRIVMLWVLIVVSPITWFMGGVKGIVTTADSVYADWWKQFVCYISIGPVLAFFLWLTLAVAGAGNIAASEGFTQGNPAGEVASSAVLEIFQFERMTAFIIGIAMIFAGFRAAQSVCSGLSEGILPAVLGKAEGFAKGAVKATVSTPAGAGRLGASAGKKGLKFADNQLGIKSGLKNTAGSAVGKVGGAIGGKIGGTLGRSLQTQSAIASSNLIGAATAEDYERTGAKDVLAAGPDVAADRLRMLLEAKNLSPKERAEAEALASDSMINGDLRKDLQKSGHFDAIQSTFGAGALKRFEGDSARKKSMKEYLKTRPDLNKDLLADPDKLAAEYGEWEDIEKLDAAALATPEIQAVLQKVKTKFKDKDGNILNAYQAIMDNKAGNAKREAVQAVLPEIVSAVSSDNYDSATGKFKPGQEHLKDAISSKISDNIEELGQIPQEFLRGDGDVSNAAQKSISSSALSSLFRKYEDAARTGNTAKQFELQNTISNAGVVVEKAAKTGGKEQEQLLKLFKKNKKTVDSRVTAVDVHNGDQSNKIKDGFAARLTDINTKNTSLLSSYRNKQSAGGKKDAKLVDSEIENFKNANTEIENAISKAIGAGSRLNKAELETIQQELIAKQKTFSASKATNERPDAAAVRAEIEAQTKQAIKTINGMIAQISGNYSDSGLQNDINDIQAQLQADEAARNNRRNPNP